jgi:hypothetical protein
MTRFEAFLLLSTTLGAFAGGITGALTGRLREVRRELAEHERACRLRGLSPSQPYDDGGPTLTPHPQ